MSDESDAELRSPENRPNIPHPIQTIQVINGVIKVLYNYKRSVQYKDIATACSMHPSNVSQALSGASDIGLTRLVGRGLYAITEDGKEYARLLSFGKEGEAKALLQKVIAKNPQWKEIITFLSATRGQARDSLDLVLEVERLNNTQWKPSMRSRVEYGLTSILEFAGFIIKEGSRIIPIAENQDFAEIEPSVNEPGISKELQAMSPKENTTGKGFAQLSSDFYIFQVKEDVDSIEFAESQFKGWIEYLKRKLQKEKQEARQSDGVPNQ